jgi:hypothetical protein
MNRVLLSLVFVLAAASFAAAQTPSSGVIAERIDLSKSVQVFPNPVIDYVHVKVESIKAEKIKLILHNIIGNEMPIETEVVGEHELRVRIKDLSSGYYLLAIREEETGFRGTYKILKR